MDSFSIPTLETERLWLRPWRASDVDDYAALNADPEVMRHISEPWDRGRSWRHLSFVVGHWPLRGTGSWAVEHKETGAFVGITGFFEPEGWPGFELAGRLGRRWWGKGYAAEAARAALDHAFTVWKKDRVISIVHPANRASVRLVERIGETLLDRIEHTGGRCCATGSTGPRANDEPSIQVDEPSIQVDERSIQMDERFIQIDERFVQMDECSVQMDECFVQIDERSIQMDERFVQMDERFVQIHECSVRMDECSVHIALSSGKRDRSSVHVDR